MISVIIPVYNTQNYLRNCLDSLCKQSFMDFEALVIDDGSSDSSGAICDQFARKDQRFRVFHLENGGVSTARNVALEHARGNYIAFLDSDDWMEPNMLETLFSMVDGSGKDAAMCDAFNADGDIRTKAGLSKGLPAQVYDREINRVFLGHSGTLWNKILGKSCIADTRFRRDLHYGEDICFLQDISERISVLHITDQPLYNYRRMREGNVVASRLSSKYADLIQTMEMAVDFLMTNGYYQEAVSRIRLCTGRVLKAAASVPMADSREYRMRCYALLRKGFRKSYWLLKNRNLSVLSRCIRFMEYTACCISPALIVLLYKLAFCLKKEKL